MTGGRVRKDWRDYQRPCVRCRKPMTIPETRRREIECKACRDDRRSRRDEPKCGLCGRASVEPVCETCTATADRNRRMA